MTHLPPPFTSKAPHNHSDTSKVLISFPVISQYLDVGGYPAGILKGKVEPGSSTPSEKGETERVSRRMAGFTGNPLTQGTHPPGKSPHSGKDIRILGGYFTVIKKDYLVFVIRHRHLCLNLDLDFVKGKKKKGCERVSQVSLILEEHLTVQRETINTS